MNEEDQTTKIEKESTETDVAQANDTTAKTIEPVKQKRAIHNNIPEPAIEHRNNARANLNHPILVQLSSGKTIKARLINLSCGGLAFEYPVPCTC